eukprot:scaffold5498_cov37-Tisochrysis_lutea.AAC.3
MKAFTEALPKGTNLKQLDLSYNKIGYAGMKTFTKAISMGALNTLANLNLAVNEIGPEGTKQRRREWTQAALRTLFHKKKLVREIA